MTFRQHLKAASEIIAHMQNASDHDKLEALTQKLFHHVNRMTAMRVPEEHFVGPDPTCSICNSEDLG